MAFCLAELQCCSTRSALQIKDTDIGTYQYYDKGDAAGPSDHHYYNDKKLFSESRGHSWTPRNRRPEKLRDSLKELEDLLQTNSVLMLSSGVLVTLTLSGAQFDRVFVDRTLGGRLPADKVSDAVLSDRLLLLSFVEKNQVCVVYLNKKNQSASRRQQEAGQTVIFRDQGVECGGTRRGGTQAGPTRGSELPARCGGVLVAPGWCCTGTMSLDPE
ncbi:hypothetical protein UPYG_G00132420 [Umbra pygmaea]|uniref:Uncharacterized protein n=1 Tax=Umbra pygmaea TaxID=75934 RepID=A0ABD0WUU8_UMBPY